MKIKIEKLIFEGFGLGHNKDGKPTRGERSRTIFVYKSVPGDELEVEIIEDKKSFAKAKINKIIKPSSLRTKPRCPYFNQCGGCEHQNIGYNDQLKLKEQIFAETLKRQGVETEIMPILAGSDSPFYYRNSIRFFFVINKNDEILFARHNFLYKEGFIEVEKCCLQSETANNILSKLKAYINKNIDCKSSFWQLKIREGKFTGEFMIEVITKDYDLPEEKGIIETLKQFKEIKSVYHTIALNKSLRNLKRRLIYGSPVIYEKIGKFKFQISPESFFQTNSLGIHTLYDKIKELAEVKMGDNVLDLYCGTGTIGIYLSTFAKKVVGVESIQKTVNDARDNAKINHVPNCEFINSDVELFLSKSIIHDSRFNILVVDPPRAGLSKEIIKKLSAISYKRLIYVSCNPATFARDIKIFETYGLKLIKVQPIDMFPQTHHIECVGVLRKS